MSDRRNIRMSMRIKPGIRKAATINIPKYDTLTDGVAIKVSVKAYHTIHNRHIPIWFGLRFNMSLFCTSNPIANKPTATIAYIADIKIPAKDGCAAMITRFIVLTSINNAKRKDVITTFLDRTLLWVLYSTI